ncbi:hypothetical protein QTP70_012138 [Hemibagrus guttatus]|uniref:Reverse transcriptase domain-containing protein n=1 Tax=Hemibagrus guttatus TaxID=175788 RepID=A0AAE0R976_9TELE|nr:hypothetical protein QTP70_012138 [Hemibagrus guttatus]
MLVVVVEMVVVVVLVMLVVNQRRGDSGVKREQDFSIKPNISGAKLIYSWQDAIRRDPNLNLLLLGTCLKASVVRTDTLTDGRHVKRQAGKGRELADIMERRKVDILCVQGTRWKGSKARSIGAGFKLFYYGVDSKRVKITGLNDYRPVALTSVVMKSFERLVLSYLKDITDPLLDPLQFAYRANRSVDDAVNMALHFILQHLDSPGSYARILFVDFSSAFNTIIPALLRDKLFQLNVPDSMCSWITDFLTDRQQFVRLGTHVSDLQHISTVSPQGCVLSPLLFSLYTNGCTSGHQSVKLLKFADDTTLIGLISDGDESAYRGTTITKDLKWEQNIRSLTKKAQQRMYFLRQLKKFLLPVKMLVNFYTAIIESVLTSSITVWFAAATARVKAKLQRVIHSAEKVIGCSLPSLQELYVSRSRRRAAKIAADPSHPGVVLKEEFVRNVLEVKRVSNRVMSLKLEIEGVMLNVVSGYAPQVGCELEEKERFWSELYEVMESIPTGERVVIGADFNGHVGEGNTGDEEVMGKFGVKERNLEGQMVVDFAKRMDMAVVNTYFQ